METALLYTCTNSDPAKDVEAAKLEWQRSYYHRGYAPVAVRMAVRMIRNTDTLAGLPVVGDESVPAGHIRLVGGKE